MHSPRLILTPRGRTPQYREPHLSSSPPGPLLLCIKGHPSIPAPEATVHQIPALFPQQEEDPPRHETDFPSHPWVGDREGDSAFPCPAHPLKQLSLRAPPQEGPAPESFVLLRETSLMALKVDHAVALLSAALALTERLAHYQPQGQGQGQGSSDGAAAPSCLPCLPWDTA